MNITKFAKALYDSGYKRELEYFLLENTNEQNLFKEKNSNQQCVSIHQPAFFGWLGYFHKIFYSDKFIILDNVLDTKGSFTNRCIIKGDSGLKYLTIPIKNRKSHLLINEFQADYTQNWPKKHLNLIYNNYKKSKYFDEVYNLINNIYTNFNKKQKISEITFITTNKILNYLNIEKEIYFSNDLKIDENLKRHNRNYALVEKLNGKIYFSGITAKNYQQSSNLPKNIKLIYQDFWNYQEKNNSNNVNFVNGLSIIDSFFNNGINETKKNLSNYIHFSLENLISKYNNKEALS